MHHSLLGLGEGGFAGGRLRPVAGAAPLLIFHQVPENVGDVDVGQAGAVALRNRVFPGLSTTLHIKTDEREIYTNADTPNSKKQCSGGGACAGPGRTSRGPW